MKFFLKAINPSKIDCDSIIVPVWEDEMTQLKGGSLNLFPVPELNKIIIEAVQKEDFDGKKGQFLTLYSRGLISPYKIIIEGFGKKDELTIQKLYTAIAQGVKKSLESKSKSIVIVTNE